MVVQGDYPRVMSGAPPPHNLLIIKRKKKRIEDFGQKYSSMILIGYEGL
jgi:hypothetical protein